jgi:hypothetical protein
MTTIINGLQKLIMHQLKLPNNLLLKLEKVFGNSFGISPKRDIMMLKLIFTDI